MTTAHTRTTARPAPAPAFRTGFDVEQHSLDAAASMCASLFGNVVRTQTQMLRFLGARFAKDAQTLEQLASCKNPGDLVQLQVKSIADAMTDYFVGTQRLIGLFETAARETLAQAA